MSDRGDRARLESVLAIISDLRTIIEGHGGTDSTLSDTEGQYAVLMCLTQIGEKLSRISSPDFLAPLPVRKSVALRNIIVHDYDRVNFRIIGEILEKDIPELEAAVFALLNQS